jgi:hypothetical protein
MYCFLILHFAILDLYTFFSDADTSLGMQRHSGVVMSLCLSFIFGSMLGKQIRLQLPVGLPFFDAPFLLVNIRILCS